MRIKYLILFFFIITLYACSENKICKPVWILTSTEINSGQIVINLGRDTLFITGLNNYTYIRKDLDLLLQSDSAIIRFNDIKHDYNEKENLNELIFDSTTYIYSASTSLSLGAIRNYFPQRDLLKYLEINCCSGLKFALLGCTCKFDLCDNYKGYKIVLTYYDKHFKENSHPKKVGFLIYKEGREIRNLRISDYYNLKDNYIHYFVSSDAVFIQHDYINKSGKWEMVIAKFLFEDLIK